MQRLYVCLLSVSPIFFPAVAAAAAVINIHWLKDWVIITTTSCTDCSVYTVHCTTNERVCHNRCLDVLVFTTVLIARVLCAVCHQHERLNSLSICSIYKLWRSQNATLAYSVLVSTSVSQRNDMFWTYSLCLSLCANDSSIFVYLLFWKNFVYLIWFDLFCFGMIGLFIQICKCCKSILIIRCVDWWYPLQIANCKFSADFFFYFFWYENEIIIIIVVNSVNKSSAWNVFSLVNLLLNTSSSDFLPGKLETRQQ